MNAFLLQNAYVYIVQRIFTNLDRYCQGRWLIACFFQINEFSSKLIFLKYCTNIKKVFDYIAVICNRIVTRLHKMYSKNVVFMILFPFFKMNTVSLYEALRITVISQNSTMHAWLNVIFSEGLHHFLQVFRY